MVCNGQMRIWTFPWQGRAGGEEVRAAHVAVLPAASYLVSFKTQLTGSRALPACVTPPSTWAKEDKKSQKTWGLWYRGLPQFPTSFPVCLMLSPVKQEFGRPPTGGPSSLRSSFLAAFCLLDS